MLSLRLCGCAYYLIKKISTLKPEHSFIGLLAHFVIGFVLIWKKQSKTTLNQSAFFPGGTWDFK